MQRTALQPRGLAHRGAARRLVCKAAATERIKETHNELKGACIINMRAQHRTLNPVAMVENSGEADLSIDHYMKDAIALFPSIQLPMGGQLERLDEDEQFLFTVPRIQIFDVWLQPKAQATVRYVDGRVVITSSACELSGSHHVQQFKLNERFNLNMGIEFTPAEPEPAGQAPRIQGEGRIAVDVDLPPPFSMLPKPLLNSTANTALQATLAVIMNTFSQSLAADYGRWARATAAAASTSAAAARAAAAPAAASTASVASGGEEDAEPSPSAGERGSSSLGSLSSSDGEGEARPASSSGTRVVMAAVVMEEAAPAPTTASSVPVAALDAPLQPPSTSECAGAVASTSADDLPAAASGLPSSPIAQVSEVGAASTRSAGEAGSPPPLPFSLPVTVDCLIKSADLGPIRTAPSSSTAASSSYRPPSPRQHASDPDTWRAVAPKKPLRGPDGRPMPWRPVSPNQLRI